MSEYSLHKGDCLEVLPKLPDNSVDLILTDPPYGTTVIGWDAIVPFDRLWPELERVLKPFGTVVMTAVQPFMSKMILSNLDMFKYTLVWRKSRAANFPQAPYRFLTEHEDIVVFSWGGTSKNAKNPMTYNPQGLVDIDVERPVRPIRSKHAPGKGRPAYKQTKTNYPKSILEFASENATFHPTQKPVALLEYLIRTFTNENETVLDFTMGSGSTGVAAGRTDRNFVGIEIDDTYFETCQSRIKEAYTNLGEFLK
jgi:site-specific DNA-methyltransferase (adenine-specific)